MVLKRRNVIISPSFSTLFVAYVDLSNVSIDQFWYSVENWIYSDRTEMLISIGWRWKIVLHAETTYFY